MKIFYKPPKSNYERIMFAAMRIMVISVTNGIPAKDWYPAENVDKEFGIYYSNEKGGKIFWTFDELQDLFVRKNNEFERFKK